jgi:hypothetical protein
MEGKKMAFELIPGTVFSLIMMIIIIIAIFISIRMSVSGSIEPKLRSLPALEAIPEAVGRCAEVGRSCFMTFGYGPQGLKGDQAGQWMAALSVMGAVADECIAVDVPMIITTCAIDTVPVANDILREAFVRQGKSEAYNLDIIRFVPAESGNQFVYVQSVLGTIAREKPGATILVGPYYAESILFGEASYYQGAYSISGTANMHQLPFFIVTTNYTLLGEETFAAGAALSGEPAQTGAIFGQDISKYITLAVLIIGVLASFFGIQTIIHFLEM